MTCLIYQKTCPNGKKRMKSNREKNQEHQAEVTNRTAMVRPKQPVYDFTGIDAVVRQWIEAHE